jgi:hypothetical protein
MNKLAYDLGVQLALHDAGIVKLSLPIKELLLHPVALGTGLGALGNVLAGGDQSVLERALRGGIAGGSIGAGIKFLPKLIRKHVPAMGEHAGDIAWLAPSLVVAPAIMGSNAVHRSRGK